MIVPSTSTSTGSSIPDSTGVAAVRPVNTKVATASKRRTWPKVKSPQERPQRRGRTQVVEDFAPSPCAAAPPCRRCCPHRRPCRPLAMSPCGARPTPRRCRRSDAHQPNRGAGTGAPNPPSTRDSDRQKPRQPPDACEQSWHLRDALLAGVKCVSGQAQFSQPARAFRHSDAPTTLTSSVDPGKACNALVMRRATAALALVFVPAVWSAQLDA
jgi:hypothetical protein